MKNKNLALIAVLFTISVIMAFANGPTPQVVIDTDQIIDGAVDIIKTTGIADTSLSNVVPATGRAALELGTMAVATATDYVATDTFTGHTGATGASVHGLGTIATVDSPVPIANGGTAATDAATARTNLGVAYGTAAGTVCQGNDARLSDARTPVAHEHSGADITSGTVADARIDASICRDSELTTHAALTATHGATGAVVGTTNTQSLTNKTLDSTNSVVGEAVKSGTVADARIASTICRDSELTTHAGTTATHGVSGAIVGTSDTQTLTNKTLGTTNSIDGEAIKSGTVADARIDAAICRDSELTTHGNLTAAHGATGAVMGTTNTQTVTNKTMSTGCSWGGTAIPVANGGTGATTESNALANLGTQAWTAAEKTQALVGSSTANFDCATASVRTVSIDPVGFNPGQGLRIKKAGSSAAWWDYNIDASANLILYYNNGGIFNFNPNGILGVATTTLDAVNKLQVNGNIKVLGVPTYADNDAAIAAGLLVGAFYKTSTGVLMIRY